MIAFSMLLSNNNRSKAYLQNLLAHDFLPASVIVLDGQGQRRPEHTDNDVLISAQTKQTFNRFSKDTGIEFDEKEHVVSTLVRHRIPYVVFPTLDVNAGEVVREAAKLSTKYIVYSGPGGSILKEEILSLGKQFIHVHPGLLPQYRGSTTLYYALLVEKKIAASVIILDKKIDHGPVLHQKTFRLKEYPVDFDYVLDPAVRTATLLEFFHKIKNKKTIKPVFRQESAKTGNTFYIIHPVLKHAAILSLAKRV